MWRGFETKALYDNHMKNQVKQEGCSTPKGMETIKDRQFLPPCLSPESLKKDEEQLNQLKKFL